MKIFGFCLIILLVACQNSQEKIEDTKIEYSSKYAKYFNIIDHKIFVELQIINPDSKQIEKKYALLKNGVQVKLSGDYIPIQVPIQSIITLNGTDIGMLDKLGLSHKISAVSNIQYVYNQTVKRSFKAGKVKNVNDFSQMNPEEVAKLGKVISYSGFGTPPTNEDKLNKLGVICIPNYDWREIHPLGKAEWIKVFACLFDSQDKSEKYFKKIAKEFIKLEKSAKKIKSKPTLISGCMIGDYWYMPSGNSYNSYLFDKAKSSYVGKDKLGTGSQTYTMEEVLKNYQQTEFWVNPGFKSKKELLLANEKYKYLKAFKTNNIYCYSHNMNHFWEMSAVEPQKVLSDLIQILHPNETSKKNLYFYKKISN
ncbi:MAG: ABC transporter substrate-binding protein [Flavobacteriia bacterium]|jgi:iron complex transport system substrate-binding protein